MSTVEWFLIAIIGLLVLLYRRCARELDYWKELGVPHDPPYPLVGNMLQHVLKMKSIGETFRDICLNHKDDKIVGLYNFINPEVIVNDIEYSQIVLVNEFSSFMDRNWEVKERRTLENHLFNFNGATWKGVRMKMAPAFTSGKLKGMVPAMANSFENTVKLIESSSKKSSNLKDLIDIYVMSVTASAVFGMDHNRLTDPNSKFRRIARKSTSMSWKRYLISTFKMCFPRVAHNLGFSLLENEIENYFIQLVLKTFEERIESGEVKDDIIQQLLQLKTKGKIEVSQWVSEEDDYLQLKEPATITETVEITDEMLVAQGFIFLTTGLDPMRNLLTMLLVELCQNRRILNKLRLEIDATLDKHKEFSWQALKDMVYLEMCLNEAMRLHPAAEFLGRISTKKFTFPNGVTLDEGTRLNIPVLKFQTDPCYFPQPLEFRPERFQTSPLPGTYLPFGGGPRICIAKRFSMLQMKVWVAQLLWQYDVDIDRSRTVLPVQTDKWYFNTKPVSSVYLQFSKRRE